MKDESKWIYNPDNGLYFLDGVGIGYEYHEICPSCHELLNACDCEGRNCAERP